MRIKRFAEVNGNEILQPIGPMVGRPIPEVIPLNKATFIEAYDGELISHDDLSSIYIDYLKLGGEPISNLAFNKDTVDFLIHFINSSE